MWKIRIKKPVKSVKGNVHNEIARKCTPLKEVHLFER